VEELFSSYQECTYLDLISWWLKVSSRVLNLGMEVARNTQNHQVGGGEYPWRTTIVVEGFYLFPYPTRQTSIEIWILLYCKKVNQMMYSGIKHQSVFCFQISYYWSSLTLMISSIEEITKLNPPTPDFNIWGKHRLGWFYGLLDTGGRIRLYGKYYLSKMARRLSEKSPGIIISP